MSTLPSADPYAAAEAEALDAYSQVVTRVAADLAPSVANLRLRRRTRRGMAGSGGSAVVLSARRAAGDQRARGGRCVRRRRALP